MRALMVLFDKNDLIIYIGGSFKPLPDAKEVCHSHYESIWDSLMMREVDGDELNMMDFTKDILKLVEVVLACNCLTLQMVNWHLGGVDDFLVMTPRISTPVPNALSQLSQADEGDDITLLEIKRNAKKDKGKSVIIDEEEENFWAELARLKATGFEDELDDDLERERESSIGCTSKPYSSNEREFEIPPGDEYYHFEVETSNVYFEPEMEMLRTEVVELKRGKKKDNQAAPSQASATQVAASSQASSTQVATPSQASATQVATPSQATKVLASTSTGKNPMTRGKVVATIEASASVTQTKSVEAK
ncbi:hypothetical protein IFM89_007559 [Coptis chinensis]|uniref:Uncharacterized protein n=1 Tax=Coptis chinensis TaxID=261450 RepID=A0A835I314_9MAGN|nr:hypothetical protein IFM89_007559 [Coptis chinensis]